MGKKRTADETGKYAEQNGFNDNDTDIDDKPVLRAVGHFLEGSPLVSKIFYLTTLGQTPTFSNKIQHRNVRP